MPTELPGWGSQGFVGGQRDAWGRPHCSWHSLTRAHANTPQACPCPGAQDKVSQPPGTHCPPPEVHRSHTFKGPRLPELLPTEGLPALAPGGMSLDFSQPPSLPW